MADIILAVWDKLKQIRGDTPAINYEQTLLEKLLNSSKYISKRASEYEKKRKFDKTPEPKAKKKPTKNQHRYVIQRHKATKDHFDLRLENDKGTMSSWVIPKHKLPKGNEKLLAKKTENHPIEYANFEGKIPKGEYGGGGEGTVKIHSKGRYKEIEWKSDKIKFEIKGTPYVLFKTDGKNWMIKEYKNKEKDKE